MVVHNLFDEITRIDNLITSWKEFRIGKKDRLDTIEFERNLEDNLWELHHELVDKTYKHSGYSSFFVQDPKLRHIHKALVRDRVLHHAIVKHINPIFEKTFIHDSYSCRKDKGTHRGVEQLIRYGRIVSKNNTQPCWILKYDIRKFFASVDQKILIDMIFQNPTWLSIVFADYPSVSDKLLHATVSSFIFSTRIGIMYKSFLKDWVNVLNDSVMEHSISN